MSRLVRVPQRANDDLATAGLKDKLGPGIGGTERPAAAPDNYLERIAKYVPGEVLAFFIFINVILEQAVRTGGKTAMMAGLPVTTVAQGALVVGLVLTPVFVWYVREDGDAWLTNTFVSTLAFPFWAYALGAVAFGAEGIVGVSVVGGVVGAVEELQRGDVVHHQRGRMMRRGVAVARGIADELAVGHHRIFVGIVIGRQRREGHRAVRSLLRRVAVLEPQRVPDLVHEAGEIVEAADVGRVVVLVIVPGVAPGERVVVARVRGRPFGGADVVKVVRLAAVDSAGFGEADVAAGRRDIAEIQAADLAVVQHDPVDGRGLQGVHRLKAVDELVSVLIDPGRRRVGQIREIPTVAPKQAVDVLVAGHSDGAIGGTSLRAVDIAGRRIAAEAAALERAEHRA